MITLDLDIDASGNRCLRDRHFDGATFPELNLDTPSGTALLLERVTFLRCRTHPGTCWIRGQTTLRNVLIEDLECGDALRIDSSCRFEQVVLRRKSHTGKLIITPGASGSQSYDHIEGCSLDITEFYGSEVLVVGIPSHRIRFNRNRHVVVHGRWRRELDWKGLGLSPVGFFGITTKTLNVHGAETGVFSLPDPKDNAKYHKEAVRDIEILRKAGVQIG